MKDQNWPEQEELDLKNGYVKTPKHFSDTVEKCVQQQLLSDADYETENPAVSNGKRWRQRRTFGWSKAVACVLIAVVALSGTAIAATHFHLLDYNEINETKVSEEDIDVLTPEDQQASAELPEIHQDVVNNQDFPNALLQIKEVYFDGAILYFYAEATDEGKNYELGSDHAVINGVDYYPDFHSAGKIQIYPEIDGEPVDIGQSEEETDEEGEDQYYGQLQLANAELTEDFTVELMVGVTKKDEEDEAGMAGFQTISFQVSVENNPAKIVEPQTIAIEDGIVNVEQLMVAPSTLHIRFTWCLSGEDAQEKIQDLRSLYLVMTDDKGNEYESGMYSAYAPDAGDWQTEVYQNEDGMWCTQKEYYFGNIPTDIKTLTIMPVALKEDENYEVYVAGECDYASFTVSLD